MIKSLAFVSGSVQDSFAFAKTHWLVLIKNKTKAKLSILLYSYNANLRLIRSELRQATTTMLSKSLFPCLLHVSPTGEDANFCLGAVSFSLRLLA